MNKAGLIEAMAEAADIPKARAERALDAAIDSIILAAANNTDGARIAGLGVFTSKRREESQGQNPRTGEKITIAARTVARFKPAKAFSDRLNPGA